MKPHHHIVAAAAEMPTTRQRLFVRYLIAILTDLAVLNLLAEHWHRVTVDGFTVALAVALLLQLLLQLTLILELRVAGWFEHRPGMAWRFGRYFCAWLILFSSKFVMLWVLDLAFDDAILFTGPMHGASTFIAALIAMLACEELVIRVYRALG
ncbi:hypothetical protein [Pseudohaliea rubra]|uniref:Transmembrane protein n=1 Tax=Pseudohaliea rubra DSM 19751 TaxID=1265313 RepID=A0A095VTJ9_9GAMM|nr:hypothetical protein [Pseudohaliea rubra]KGE04413.1 hypothetical protein HRUBRA_00997 [Pseudohaliea rubra DSM 19751]